MPYDILSHTADTGIEATAASFSSLVEHLCFGMFDLMADLEELPATGTATVSVDAARRDELVVDLLAELLYQSEVEHVIFTSFEASISESGGTWSAQVDATTVPMDAVELWGPPLKAVTYHDLLVEEREDHWYGRVVFDV